MSLDSIFKEQWKEILIIIVAAVILGLSFSYLSKPLIFPLITSFFILISLNTIAKKIMAYYYETDLKIRFWKWSQFWFTEYAHFKKPMPMLWLPPLVSLISQGAWQWLAILEFDIQPKTERVSKRHGLYRFSQLVEYHVAVIATTGIAINLIVAVISYIIGFQTFAQLNIYYAFWSIIPLSGLDGYKILAGSKILWTTLLIITGLLLVGSLIIA